MYKLLLVDDEPIIREGLERMIDWEKAELENDSLLPERHCRAGQHDR